MKALKFIWELTKIIFLKTLEISAIVLFAVGVIVTAFYIAHLIDPAKF